MRRNVNLDRDWKFRFEFHDEDKNQLMQDGEDVILPHTVKKTPYHYFAEHVYQTVSSYQRILEMQPDWEGKLISITFEGAGHEASVYLNGQLLGSHHNGYTAFTLDLTGKLKKEEANLLTVKLDSRESLDQPPFGYVIDYMTYGGLYRDVYLTIRDQVSIEDAFYMPSLPEGVSTSGKSKDEIRELTTAGFLETELALSSKALRFLKEGRLSVRQTLDDQKLLERRLAGEDLMAEKDLSQILPDTILPQKIRLITPVSKVRLWDCLSPYRYHVVTELLLDGTVIDSVSEEIGFVSREFRADGFYLNGRKFKIRGLNRHQSYAYVGYAMPESMQRYDAKILKNELGCNAVRTSHYPQSHYFIDECDRLGLLVFMEIPGWQHIGGDKWKDQAVLNVKEMIEQYRNHPSIMIWGVRINESKDDDPFYTRTNAMAHAIDPTRQTGGVRCNTANKNTNILEDVFTYNDFSHNGMNAGCLKKEKATNDMNKGYLVTEYNGHMYPTKPYDWEEHRSWHMLRHATVLNAVAGEDDIAGSFGWCMFDYNTHKDFGSGDRICYHGVMDMFRNKKLAAEVYAAEGSEDDVLEVSSSMDIGEHPASNRGDTYIISNADQVRMYKENQLLKVYKPSDSAFTNLEHGPILIDDYVGNMLVTEEHMSPRQAAICKHALNGFALNKGKMTFGLVWDAIRLIAIYHMNPQDAVSLFQRYIGNWGGSTQEFRFDAVRDGEVVKSVIKAPVQKVSIETTLSSGSLMEDKTYDVVEIRVRAVDQYQNVLPFYNDPLLVKVEGPAELIGPALTSFEGGQTGLYLRSTGKSGEVRVTLGCVGAEPVQIKLTADAGEQ